MNTILTSWLGPSLACLWAGLFVVVAAAAPAHAEAVVTYDMTFVDRTRTGVPAVHSSVTATRYTARGNTQISTSRTHLMRLDTSVNASKVATIDAAIASDTCGEFSVTVKRGRQLNLASLDIGMQLTRGADGESFNVHLRTSLDDYAQDIATATLKGDSNADVVDGRGSFDLSAPQFQNLSGTVTFRLYMVSDIGSRSEGSRYVRIMPNVVLNGSATPAK